MKFNSFIELYNRSAKRITKCISLKIIYNRLLLLFHNLNIFLQLTLQSPYNPQRGVRPSNAPHSILIQFFIQPYGSANPSLTRWAGSGHTPARRRYPAGTRCSSAPRACWCPADRTRPCGRIPTGCRRQSCPQIPVRRRCQS